MSGPYSSARTPAPTTPHANSYFFRSQPFAGVLHYIVVFFFSNKDTIIRILVLILLQQRWYFSSTATPTRGALPSSYTTPVQQPQQQPTTPAFLGRQNFGRLTSIHFIWWWIRNILHSQCKQSRLPLQPRHHRALTLLRQGPNREMVGIPTLLYILGFTLVRKKDWISR